MIIYEDKSQISIFNNIILEDIENRIGSSSNIMCNITQKQYIFRVLKLNAFERYIF